MSMIVTSGTLPAALQPLAAYPQFVLYKVVPSKTRAGKTDKFPVSVTTGQVCDGQDRQHWGTFDQAANMARAFGDGYAVGFIVTQDDPFYFLDIDECASDGQWSPVALDLMARLRGAAVEVSHSGTGLHLFGCYTGDEPTHACRNIPLGLELYTSGRLVALTGSQAMGDAGAIQDDQLAGVIEHYFPLVATGGGGADEFEWTTAPHPESNPIADDDELIAKALSSKPSASGAFGGKASFSDLWYADADALSKHFPDNAGERPYDASSADAALANHLRFWTGGDCERMERLMRRSALVRPKWDQHRSYMRRTFARVSGGSGSFYGQQRQTAAVADGDDDSPISEAARQLADTIAFRLNKHIPDMTVTPDNGVIQRMIDGCFWSGSKSKLFVFNNQQSLNQYTSSDAVAAMSRWFGSIVDSSVIESNAVRYGYETGSREMSKLCTLPTAIVLHHLQDHNQRESVEWRVDMFADEPRMDINEDIVKVILTHKPFRVDGSYSQRIIDDYKKHFTRLDEFLKLIAMAKFAIDRKKAYLWIHASSDWGKGMLINGVLGSLGAVVETSTKEIETLFEGRPVGKSPIEFKRCCALVVDEFKSVKSELKQLQNTMTLSPKNQLSSTVEIFAKVFMSAESVNSLVTENGVEDQFANRMSIFEEHGSIESRALWATEGKARYTENVRSYAAHFLNAEIARLQSLGREAATAEADQWLVDFHGRYGIGNTHGRFSDTLLTVAKDMIEWINRPANRTGLEQSGKLVADGGEWYLCHPGTVISEYIDGHYDSTERGAYMKRKRDLQALLSADGRGVVNHRIAGGARKCILLRKPDDDPTARALRNAAQRS